MKPIIKIAAFILITGLLFHLSCKKEYSCENCKEKNKPPIANAGPDQVITLPTDSVLLDGAASSDLDGTISSFLWTKISGPASFNINNVSAAKTTAKNLIVGVYQFELKVTDNGGLSAKDTMRVIVDSVAATNHPPVANAGGDVNEVYCVLGGWIGVIDTAVLDGSGSTDPDNNIVSYQWTRISGPPLPALSPVNVPGHPEQIAVINIQPGTVIFELKVTDAGGLFSKDTAQVTIFENHSPIASIAPISSITLPTNFIDLDGRGSTDPENNIGHYEWTKISGPASFNITNPAAAQTTVTNLVQGSYQFQLKVTDACGLSSTDMIQVIVNPAPPPPPTTCDPGIRPLINAQLVPVGTLSQARAYMAVSSAGDKILFAGGKTAAGINSRVDIYDIATNTGTTAELSQARNSMGAIAYGNKIFFAGGKTNTSLTSRIDIYDLTTNSWSTHELSVPRRPSAATAADKVVFAGGVDISLNEYGIDGADIYNASTNTWSTSAQGGGRQIGAVTSVGNKIYFAGGYAATGLYDEIDIYDAVSNSWSGSTLSQYKAAMAGIAVDNKIYWAGGDIYNIPGSGQTVEIRDINTQTTSFACLFQPNYGSDYGENSVFDAVLKDNKIVFFTGQGTVKNKFDIYDITTNTWSIGVLTLNIEGASIISVNNTIYVAGGYVNGVLSNQVWKLEF